MEKKAHRQNLQGERVTMALQHCLSIKKRQEKFRREIIKKSPKFFEEVEVKDLSTDSDEDEDTEMTTRLRSKSVKKTEDGKVAEKDDGHNEAKNASKSPETSEKKKKKMLTREEKRLKKKAKRLK